MGRSSTTTTVLPQQLTAWGALAQQRQGSCSNSLLKALQHQVDLTGLVLLLLLGLRHGRRLWAHRAAQVEEHAGIPGLKCHAEARPSAPPARTACTCITA